MARDAMGLAIRYKVNYMVRRKGEPMSPSIPRRLIRRDELKRRVPYSLTHVWRLERRGQFPKRIVIGENRVARDEAEVDALIEARIRAGKDTKLASPRKAAAAAGER